MLIHALILTLIWFVISAVFLLTVGRRLGGPSFTGSLVLILILEAIGAALGLAHGMPSLEVSATTVVSTLLGLLVIRAFPSWNPAGHAAWLFLSESAGLYLIVAAVFVLLVPTGLAGELLGLILLIMQLVALVLTLSYTHELLDVVCRRRWRLPAGRPPRLVPRSNMSTQPAQEPSGRFLQRAVMPPRVALHVPCHNEPPEIVEHTLLALAQLDYPRDRYAVYVVDNNTADAALWQPLARICGQLGFTFLHLTDWPGFKSGALNYALAATPLHFDLIGVVDADYLVDPAYLRDLVGAFDDSQVAFIQTPQDYRDYGPTSTFYQRACYHAYRYFFDLSMPSRNERNAIIFGGTMGLIRADALRSIGGWDEWCITEDAEASLRLLARGYAGQYINRSYGRGLMPLEFDALKRQRFRWCFGGIQILRKHWPLLMPWTRRTRPAASWEAPGLTASQRYHYLLGGLQWYSDVLTLGFTTLLLVTGTLLLAGHPVHLPVLGGPLLLLPLTFWMTSLLRTLWGLRATRHCTWREALGAVGVLWSLSWVVTLASLQGLVRREGVFLRTPKASSASLARVLSSTTVETLLGGACWALGLGLLGSRLPHMLDLLTSGGFLATAASVSSGVPWWLAGTSGTLLGLLAMLQGSAYLTAPLLCLLSLRSEVSAREAQRRALSAYANEGTAERRLLVGVLVALLGVVALVGGASLLPQSSGPVGRTRQHTLSSLLGDSNPLATPTVSATATPTLAPTMTATAGGSPTPAGSPTGTALSTATPTPRPHGTPTPQPTADPTPHGPPPTPTPHK